MPQKSAKSKSKPAPNPVPGLSGIGPAWVGVGLVLITVAIFWEVGYYDFFAADDNAYVRNNSLVRGGLTFENVVTASTTVQVANYHPLTMVSLMADTSVFGRGPGGYHLTNLVLHLANVLLVFGVFRAMTGAVWPSALVAALFAIHPLHVEPVVWISSRKDVLSTFFWLLAMGAYVRYVGGGGKRIYVLVALFLLLGLLAKQMLVTLPFVFCLLDYWPLRRYTEDGVTLRRVGQLAIEKVPLFGVVLVFALVSVWVQSGSGAVRNVEDVSIGARLLNTPLAYGVYALQTVVPVNLQAIGYMIPKDLALWEPALAMLFVVGATVVCLWKLRSAPYLAVGWFWFVGTFVPVIGLVTLGATYRADRYTYVPLIGLFVIVAWGGKAVYERVRIPNKRRVAAAIAGVLLLAYGSVAWRQVGLWRNGMPLLEQTLEVSPDHLQARFSLGTAHLERGQHREAAHHLGLCIANAPTFAPGHIRMGTLQLELGNYERAEFFYSKGLSLLPGEGEAILGLGQAKARLGKSAEAEALFLEALQRNPSSPMAQRELALLRGEETP